jgi:hypothetical protein
MNAPGREEVSLDQFDRANARDWDEKLTIEIISSHAALARHRDHIGAKRPYGFHCRRFDGD